MTLDDLTDAAAVNAAMDEYDALGGDAFLSKYGYSRARDYFVARAGRLYDSKAIAGVAVGKQHPGSGPLTAKEFSGGEATVSRKMRELGFIMFGGEQGGLSSAEALTLVRSALGDEMSKTKYIAVWRVQGGRELALQLEQSSARFWTESPPPLSQLNVTPYGAHEPRHSNLTSNARRLAPPNPAWMTVVASRDDLSSFLEWYTGNHSSGLDEAAFRELVQTFKRWMPDFVSFAEQKGQYFEQERLYKSELVDRFRAEIGPQLGSAPADDEAYGELATALHRLLTSKLPSTNKPQDLVNWQASDWFKPVDAGRSAKLGRALYKLLTGPRPSAERLIEFISVLRKATARSGATDLEGDRSNRGRLCSRRRADRRSSSRGARHRPG